MHTSPISALPSAWRAASGATHSAAASSVASGTASAPVSARQAILRMVAAEVLGALTHDAGGLRGQRGREGAAHSEHGSAGAVAQALKSAAARGADAPALLAKVRDGIDKAQVALTEQGYDPAQVAAATSQFTDSVASLMEAPAAEPASPVDALAASVQISRKERGSLVLTTQDGDVLRIRFRNSERQSVELAAVSTGSAEAASVHLSSTERSRTRIDVQGSLDAGELKAIEDFVSQVDTLANEFFEGDLEAAFAAAAKLDYDASEIAGFSLKLGMSERVQASAVQRTVVGNADGIPAPEANDVADAPASGNTPPVATHSPAGTVQPSANGTASDPLRTVQDFMQRILGAADAPLGLGGFKLAWSAKVKLAAEIVSASTAGSGEKPGATLLTDALDAAALQAGGDAPKVKLAEAA